MSTTKTKNRVDELRAALSQAQSDLADARERLGLAIADGDDAAASEARAEVERLERFHGELTAALPVTERRAREAAQVEAQRQQRARERAANAARKQRLAQAKKVDAAMRKLGAEYEKLRTLDAGGTGSDAGRVLRRARYSARGAFAHFAPSLSRVLEVPVIPAMHRRPLVESERGLITEFAEAEDSE